MGAEGGEAQWKRRFRSHGCGIETTPGVHPWKLVSLDYSKLNPKLLRGVGSTIQICSEGPLSSGAITLCMCFRVSLLLCYWVG